MRSWALEDSKYNVCYIPKLEHISCCGCRGSNQHGCLLEARRKVKPPRLFCSKTHKLLMTYTQRHKTGSGLDLCMPWDPLCYGERASGRMNGWWWNKIDCVLAAA
ncbi:hypothetical protein QR685DRAFT_260443 [Neurospora intermedia]|uniref:Questionable protein n=1 Tax=Neurospora intermedia TaxID=5142 RepID=A0ABR3DDI9_NEUIN